MSDSEGAQGSSSTSISAPATAYTALTSQEAIGVPCIDHGDPTDTTERLILSILMEDHAEFLAKQKGKEKAGSLSDLQLSLRAWEDELTSRIRVIEVSKMALSISEAIASDQHVMASLQEQESIAHLDREYAMRISGQHEAPKPQVQSSSSAYQGSLDHDSRAIIEVTDALAKSAISTAAGESVNTQGSLSETQDEEEANCVACMEPVKKRPSYLPRCGHQYCDECLRRVYLSATDDEELYPPRCCSETFPPSLATRLLSYQELVVFCRAGVEYLSKDRYYCADPACSTFIPSWMIQDQRAQCPACSKSTHTACRALGEPDHECPSDEALQSVLALAEEQGWKRCPRCKTMVELRRGCNHMTCRCGSEFCYVCAALWKTCGCALWHEDRLYDIAHRAVGDQARRRAGGGIQAQALEEVVENLRNHDCQHHVRSQWRYTTEVARFECEMCHHVLPQYIFECRQCLMLACNRCMRNRTR